MKNYLAPNVTVNVSTEQFTFNFLNIEKSVYKGKEKLDKKIKKDRILKKCSCNRDYMNEDYSGVTKTFCANYGLLYESLESCDNPYCVLRLDEMKKKSLQLQLEVFRTNNRGWGLKTRSRIMPLQYICEYVGELWLKDEYINETEGWYCYEVEYNDITYVYDSEKEGNFARMINHSCENNCVAISCCFRDDLIYKGNKIPQVGIFAADKVIEPGEEICINYNKTYFTDNFVCLCEADTCIYKKKRRQNTFFKVKNHNKKTK